MAWERIAENRIREAMQQGEFDNLPGAGKPIDLDGYFKLRRALAGRRAELAMLLERSRRV